MNSVKSIRLVEGNTVQLSNEGEDDNTREFEMVLYTGASVSTLLGPMVFDLKGIRLGAKRKPVLLNHSTVREDIVGHSTAISKDKERGILLKGVMSAGTDGMRMIEGSSDKGFPWQASMGITIDSTKSVAEGESIEVNNITIAGPVEIVAKSTLKEASFVPLGADDATSAVVLGDRGEGWVDLTNDSDETIINRDNHKESDHMESENLEAVKTEIRDEEQRSMTAKLAEMNNAFPDRPQFVISQVQLGHNVEQAKADFADILLAENKTLADSVTNLKGQVAANENIVGAITGTDTTVSSTEAEDKPKSSDPKDVAAWEWDTDAELQGRFPVRASYVAVRNAELTGRLNIVGQARLGKTKA